nr:hypothetical protein [Pseudomonas kitaguniensis]
MTCVRIALPPLHSLTADSEFEFARLDRNGCVSHSGVSSLLQLAASAQSQAVECFLHPADSVLTHVQLPPLSREDPRGGGVCGASADPRPQ